MASLDLDWACEEFIKTYGASPQLETGEVIQTNNGLLYLYGKGSLSQRIHDTHLKFKEKEELSFTTIKPAEMKAQQSDLTYYVAIFQSNYFLCVSNPEKGFLRCHNRPFLYPIVAHGSMS
ncbi:hypothetical protein G6L26_028110 (plasmid) [Agrobacterium radiobacter]|uniref:Uncharacterized protein n=1 Tax=Agrobacterium tumefaciens TaxID=358 RepID=A0A2Z2PYE4_AGRTU|nr:hypothetical protein [Agrobacterium tumefaciens]ASK47201.1 hypothetical protein [Agrobacterium radiobacter]NSY99414.1 hypothetical protein [Agrobacterium tumefaciens]QQE35115.1 hypothetical protein I6I05_18060 [Agrobacterium tumefaciens]